MCFFKKKSKYDVSSKNNQPRIVYGIPNPNNIVTKEIIREQGIQFIRKISENNEVLQKKLEEYMDNLPIDIERKYNMLQYLSEDNDVLNEFLTYINTNDYPYENAINVGGVTAKSISEQNPNLSALEVYIKLTEIKLDSTNK